MKALRLMKYGGDLALENIPIPSVGAEQVLIKVKYAPINPSDLYYSKGVYGVKHSLPTIPGFECSGEIAEAGINVPKSWIGRKVAAWADDGINSGTWGQYFLTNKGNAILLDHTANLKDFSCPFSNPFTAMGFLDIVKRNNFNGAIFSASFSSVAKMSIRLFQRNGLSTVSIIRKQEQIEKLKELGAQKVLLSSDKDFKDLLKSTLADTKIRCFFDSVGGDLASTVFAALPNHSTMYCYGVFSLKRIDGINPQQFIFRGKKMEGFWVKKWIQNKTHEEQEEIKETVKNLLVKELHSEINGIYSVDHFAQAFRQYEKEAAQGKILLELN